jgi:hypothetical protein
MATLQWSLLVVCLSCTVALAQRSEPPVAGVGRGAAAVPSGSTSHPGLPNWERVPEVESGLGPIDRDVKVPWIDVAMDVNDDGHLDFCVYGHHGGAAVWYLNDGKGRFKQEKVAFFADRLPANRVHERIWPGGGLVPLWYDFNGDGRRDSLAMSIGGIWLDLGNLRYKPISPFSTGESNSHQMIVCADGSGIFEHWPEVDGIRFLDPRPPDSQGRPIEQIRFRAPATAGWTWREMGIDLFDQLPEKYTRPGVPNPSYCVDLDGDGVLDLIVRRRMIGTLGTDNPRGEPGAPLNAGWRENCRTWVLRGRKGQPPRVANKEMGLPDGPMHTLVPVDLNRDGHLDVLDVFTGEVYLNDGHGRFTKGPGTIRPAPQFADDGHVWFMDPGNTGYQSFFLTANHAYAPHLATAGLYVNDGTGSFTRVVPPWAAEGQFSGWVIVPGDFDGDGFLDFVVGTPTMVTLYRNQGIPGHHYLKVIPVQKYKCNSAMGCKLWIYEAGKLGDPAGLVNYQQVDRENAGYRKSAAVFIHAGLGSVDRVDLRLKFPITGKIIEMKDVRADTTVTITESQAEATP